MQSKGIGATQDASSAFRWFDSSVWTSFRGRASYDGGLTNFIPLPPSAQHGVRVCCFPSKQVGLLLSDIHLINEKIA